MKNTSTIVLGVYWYFGFPEGLYDFDYFTFKPAHGGQVNDSAELSVAFETIEPDSLISSLKKLAKTYPEVNLLIKRDGKRMQITMGGYSLYDYDFQFAKKVENVLKDSRLKMLENQELTYSTNITLGQRGKRADNGYSKKDFLQIVGSEMKKHHAENLKLQLDCSILTENKADFITELKRVLENANIEVFYYLDQNLENKSNLMLFFTNGRQGLDLQSKTRVYLHILENKIELLLEVYHVQTGHLGGLEYYPQGNPNIEMMMGKEFII